ncbi:unnamed protein product [Orchesella dallaii]|uniref:Uncharacterized protein n=1 Tax=Orchesella dallaii TaxID=48710 RepID=A0ABP1S8A5_9HEXA
MPKLGFISLPFVFIVVFLEGDVAAYRRRMSTFYNPAVEYDLCPSGYAYHYLTNSCVWIGPQPTWQMEMIRDEDVSYSNLESKSKDDHKCPDGYKFSKVLRLCLLPQLCGFCRRGGSAMKKQEKEVGSATTDKPLIDTTDQTPYAIPYECLCEL